MKKLLFMFVVVLFLPVMTMAQDTPKAEVFGGYSYLRADGLAPNKTNLNGWEGSVTGNLNSWFGVTADFSGHYGTPDTVGLKIHDRIHNFLFGPTVSYRKNDKFTPFAHVLVGGSHLSGSGSSPTISASFSNTDFAMAVGGGVDWKAGKKFSIRLVQADYLLIRDSGTSFNNLRISTGIVFNFGKK